MKLKLDENLSRHLKQSLAALQHDAVTVADEDLLAKPDGMIAKAAKQEERILLTLDVAFGDLRKYPPGSHPGMVVFRPESLGPLAVNRFIEEFVKNTDLAELTGCIAIVEPASRRIDSFTYLVYSLRITGGRE